MEARRGPRRGGDAREGAKAESWLVSESLGDRANVVLYWLQFRRCSALAGYGLGQTG
jgi:hypothetical protein